MSAQKTTFIAVLRGPMPYRFLLLTLILSSLVLQAESCWFPGPLGLGEAEDDGNAVDDPEGRCTELPGGLLPGLGFIPRHQGLFIDGPLWVVDPNSERQGLLAFDVDELPPASFVPSRDITIPDNSDGDSGGNDDSPVVNGIRIESLSLGLITANTYDEVLFFNPSDIDTRVDGGLARYEVSVPIGFLDNDYPNLPDRGPDNAESRTAVSTRACVRASGLKNSDLSDVSIADVDRCEGEGSQTYYSTSTTGAVVINDRLFVSMNNPEEVPLEGTRIYRPGAVLVFDFKERAVSPIDPDAVPSRPALILTDGYNPTDVIEYTTGGDEFVLVVVSGAVGFDGERFVKVDPSEAFIEVIDADSLELVDRVSLGNAALSGVSALDPDKGVLVVGSVAERTLYGVDLERLSNPSAEWKVNRLDITPLDPADDCLGSISGMSISDDLTEIYAVDFCDGILTVVSAANDGTLTEGRQIEIAKPIDEPAPDPDPEATAEEVILKAPGHISVRPGAPGVSHASSDLFYLVSLPEGRVCAQNVQAN